MNKVSFFVALALYGSVAAAQMMPMAPTNLMIDGGTTVPSPSPGNWPQPPMPGMPVVSIDGNTRYENGSNTLLTYSGGSVVRSDVGAFRISCKPSHTNFDDALVYPGDVGRAHNHSYFGNTAMNANANLDNIRNIGNSTCAGGSANKSGYWTPSMINTRTGRVIKPAAIQVYYKSGYAPYQRFNDIRPLPPRLRMLAGWPMNTGTPGPGGFRHDFYCDYDGSPRLSPEQHGPTIPTCIGDAKPNQYQFGAVLNASLDFPNCWNGRDIDSPNHRDHMAYGTPQGCPSSHPVLLASITFNVSWRVEAGETTADWKLSDSMPGAPAGYSFHGDWVNGWNPDIEAVWLNNCVKASVDCHSNTLGDGRGLVMP